VYVPISAKSVENIVNVKVLALAQMDNEVVQMNGKLNESRNAY